MNLAQAYSGWQQQSQNRTLYAKTREAFRKAWFDLPTNKPCSYYTKEVLGEALAKTREIESNKAKAASVMIHVLTFANWAEPKFNPKPDFTMDDLMEYTKGPLADPDKIGGKNKPAEKPSCLDDMEDDTDLDVDPVTALPRRAMAQEAIDTIKVREKMEVPELDINRIETDTAPEPCDEHGNALSDDDSRDQLAGIDFNEETKTQEDMKTKKPKGRQPKPIVQIDPDSLQVIKEWPSMSDATKELGLCHVEVAISKLRKAGGFYWSLAADADTFKARLEEKQRQADERQKQQAEKMREKKTLKTVIKPSPAVQVANTPDPTPSSVTQHQPEDEQPRNAANDALESFTDDELLEELDRRGWTGELRRTLVVTIGKE